MAIAPIQDGYYVTVDSIDLTTGVYYNSNTRTIRVPTHTHADEALREVVISGTIKSYQNGNVVMSEHFSNGIGAGNIGHRSDNGRYLFYWSTTFTTQEYIVANSLPVTISMRITVEGTNNGNFGEQTVTLPMTIDVYEASPQWISALTNQTNSVNCSQIFTFPATSIRIHYTNGGDVTLSGSAMNDYLLQNNTEAECEGIRVTFPQGIDMSDSRVHKDYEMNVSYILNNNSSTFSINIAVDYFEPMQLIYATTDVGSRQNPLHLGGASLTLPNNFYAARTARHLNRYVHGSFTSTVTQLDITSETTASKTTFTRADVEAMNGNPYNVEIEWQYSTSYNYTLTGFIPVYIETLIVTRIAIDSSDTGLNYYQGEDSYFVTPSFDSTATFSLVFHDGSTEVIDPADIVTKEYKLHADDSEAALVAGSSIVGAGYSQLYVHIVLQDGRGGYGAYNIYRKQDTITSVSLNNSFTFNLGNRLEKYKGNLLQITAVWENPAKANDTNYTNYTFDYTAIVMTDSDLGNSTTIHIGNTQFSIDVSGLTYSRPAISEFVVVDSTGIQSSYQNELQAINVSEVKLKLVYADAEYSPVLVFSPTNVVATDKFAVSINNTDTQTAIYTGTQDVNYINGTNELNLSTSQSLYNCEYEFEVVNEFTGIADSYTIPFVVMTLTEITGIKILQAYRDYKVGETFLNENDTTKVMLFFTDSNNATASITVDLKQDIPTISTNYAKGTEWTLPDSSKRIVVSSVFDANVTAEYTIHVEYDGYVSGYTTHNLVVVWQPYITCPNGDVVSPREGVLGIYYEDETTLTDGIRTKNAGATLLGYIDNIFDLDLLDAQAKMVLFQDYIPPTSFSPNITIKYPSYTGLADNINKCQFGILFGNNNANNRLFVSGNPNVPNADWHSAETNTLHTDGEPQKINGDFSYFPAEDIMFYGETDNKVIGYDIVSNDKLLVLKDKSDKEKTVYFRTPIMVTALDASGNAIQDQEGNNTYQEEFALVKGNNSVAGVSPHSIINLNGDTLFLDADNTVQGLDLTGIIGDNQRYANSRSLLIDQYLKDLDLSSSFLWTNNKYMFLPIKDKGMFVTHIKAKTGESNQYEWWLLQSENPTTFVEIDNVIYFGNEKGELYRMENNEYRDEYKVFVNEGQGLVIRINDSSASAVVDGVTIPAESIVVSQTVFDQLFPADRPYYDEDGNQIRHLYFRSINETNNYRYSLFYQVGNIFNRTQYPEATNVDLQIVTEDGVSYLEICSDDTQKQAHLIRLIKENQDYYLNYYSQEGVQGVECNTSSLFYNNYNNKFRLVFVEGSGCRYLMKIYNEATGQWDDIDLSNLYKANLVTKVEGDFELCDVDSETNSFHLKDEAGELMNIVIYGEQGVASTFQAEITERRNVVAYYVTAPFTMGNLNFFKTIWQITLTNDTGKPSEYDLSVASNKIPVIDTKTIASISKAMIGTNFNDYTFNAIDFDKDVVPRTYTMQRTLGRQKFVCFAFKNENNTNAILSSLSVIYTIPFPSYGND